MIAWLNAGGGQLKVGRDMTCYNGDLDVDFENESIAFGGGSVMREFSTGSLGAA
jgi:hypothetical protein